MDLLVRILSGAWETLQQAAPYILLGLVLGGVLHVLLDAQSIQRRLGGGGLRSVTLAALLGIPLPICSCAIVPASIELHRKGASRAASLSFLITTPESGVDSILVTWGMLGPIMAVARPVASFLTALLAGAIALLTPSQAGTGAQDPAPPADPCSCDEPLVEARAVVGAARRHPPLVRMARHAFIDLLDDLVFWLVLGFLVAGAIIAMVPGDLAKHGLGSGIAPMLIMLAVGIPMYMCASASTPVGAALIGKGLSPGAALVFLLSGPATNAATLVLLLRHFGRTFVAIYLASVAVASVVCGLLLDALVRVVGWRIAPRLAPAAIGVVEAVHWLPVVLLCGLMLWRLAAGAGRQGVRELAENFRGWVGAGARAGG